MSKTIMLAALLGQKRIEPILEIDLPVHFAELAVHRGEQTGEYKATIDLSSTLPNNIEGKTLYIPGGEAGIEISVLNVPNPKTIEFLYDGEEDLTGRQDFFEVKNFRVFPLSSWSNVAQVKWFNAKSEISKIYAQTSPLANVFDALRALADNRDAYQRDLDTQGRNRGAGDNPFDLREAQENVAVINELCELAKPLYEKVQEFDLVPTATVGQIYAQLRTPKTAILEIALGMKTDAEYDSLAAIDDDNLSALFDMVHGAIEQNISLKTTAAANKAVAESDLPEDSQNVEGKDCGESTLEQQSKLPGVSEELLEQE